MTTASEGYVMAELISPYVRSVPAPGSIAKMETSVRFKSVYFVILTSKKTERGKNVKYTHKCVC